MLEPEELGKRRSDLADALRDLRLEKGLTGDRLAARCGISQSKISKIETGKDPMRRDYFNDRIWKPALKEAGLPADTTFHDLRHSFASTALAEGVPITHVSKWLGHASITETVDTYGHLLPESDENLRVAMDTAWRRSNSTGGADIVLTSAQ